MKENLFEIYIKTFDYISESGVSADIVPPIQRRRLSEFDKLVFTVLNNTIDADVQNIICASRYGEMQRLKQLISQYTESNEVSPNLFAGSVHNFPIAFFLLNTKKPIQYTALAGGRASISNGFLSAVLSKYDNIIFCYADVIYDKNYSFAVNFSKSPLKQAVKYSLKLTSADVEEPDFMAFVKLFKQEIDELQTPVYLIKKENI